MPSQPRMPYGNSNDFQNPYESYEQSKQFVHPNLSGDVIEDADQQQQPVSTTITVPTPAARRGRRNNTAPTAINNNAAAGGTVAPVKNDSAGSIESGGSGDAGRVAQPRLTYGMALAQRPSLSSLGQDGGAAGGGGGGMDDIYEEDEEDRMLDEQEANLMMLDDDEYADDDDDEARVEELNEDDVIKQLLPQPPDGGYGWIIVIMSFLLNMIVDGISYSFAILLNEWLDYFQDSKGKTAWIGSLLTGVYLLIGPITSALVNSYGCRTISMAGGIIAGIGFALSALAPSTSYLIVTYGIMGGIGFGLMFLPAIVLLSLYFVKKRAIATGIAVAGSGVGGFLFPPIISGLLSIYSWRDTMLIMAGIALQGCVCGALMRPLEPQISVMERQRRASQAVSYRGAGGGGARGSDADGNTTGDNDLYDETAAAAAQEAAARRGGRNSNGELEGPAASGDIEIQLVGDKVRYNPEKLKVTGLLKRMKIAREVAKRQRDDQRQRCRYNSETIDTLETVSSEMFSKYKVNVEPGVHSVHSLHKILTNVGFDFDKLPRRLQTPPHNLNNYSLQVPRHRSHHSEMHVSSSGLPRGGTPSTGSMPPINESEIYSGPGAAAAAAAGDAEADGEDNDADNDGVGGNENSAGASRISNSRYNAARSNKYGRHAGGMTSSGGNNNANFNAGVRRHRNHVSYATTGVSDEPPQSDSTDGNAVSVSQNDANQAPPTPTHAAAAAAARAQRLHQRRRSSQQGRPSIMSTGSRSTYSAANGQPSGAVSRQPSLTPNTLAPPSHHLGVSPKLRSTPSQTSTGSGSRQNAPNIARPMYRDDIFYTGSIVNLPEYKQARNVSNYLASTTHIPDEEIMNAAAPVGDGEGAEGENEQADNEEDGQNPPSYDNAMATSFISSRRGSSRAAPAAPPSLFARLLPSSARATLKNMLGMDLLKNHFFSLYCLANLMCMIAFYIPYVYLPDMAIMMSDGQLDASQAAYILSVIGIANTFSRVLFGALVTLHRSDGSKYFDALWVNNITLIITGILTCAFPLVGWNYTMLMVLGAAFGVVIAPFIALTSIIVVDRVGVGSLSNAMGLLCLFRGIAAVAGPPLAGMLYDATGSFLVPFWCAGLFIVASALITTAISLKDLCTNKRQLKNEQQPEKTREIMPLSSSPPPAVQIIAPSVRRSTNNKDIEMTNRFGNNDADRNVVTNAFRKKAVEASPYSNGIGGDDDDEDDNEIDDREFNAAMQSFTNDAAQTPLIGSGDSTSRRRNNAVPQIVVDSDSRADSMNAAAAAAAAAVKNRRRSSDKSSGGVSQSSYSTFSQTGDPASRRGSADTRNGGGAGDSNAVEPAEIVIAAPPPPSKKYSEAFSDNFKQQQQPQTNGEAANIVLNGSNASISNGKVASASRA